MKVKLKEICQIEKGKQIDTSKLNNDSYYKYINGGIKESGFYSEYNTEGETILVSEGGASCGYVNYISERFWCGCHCYRLTDCVFYPKYIYYALKGNQDKIMALRTGAAMPNIKKSTFQELEIKVNENIEIQQTIVHHLDTIQSAIDNKQQQLKELDELVKSRFIEMFGDPIRNTKNFSTKKVIEVVTLQRGYDLPVQDRDLTGNIPVFGSNGILGSHSIAKINKGIITGRSGTIGEVYMCDKPFWPLNTTLFSNDTHGNNLCYLKYLLEFFDLKRFKSGVGVPTLNRNEFHGEQIIDVSLELQNSFSDFVQQIDKSKFVVKQQIAALQELMDSKMQEYFGD